MLGSVVPLQAFKALGQTVKARLQDPYFIALEDAIIFATTIARDMLPEEEFVEIICDREKTFRSKALATYDACEDDHLHGKYLAGIGFGRMDRVLPLQAADFIAYELLQIGRGFLDQRNRRQRRYIASLTETSPCHFSFNHRTEELERRVPLKYRSKNAYRFPLPCL